MCWMDSGRPRGGSFLLQNLLIYTDVHNLFITFERAFEVGDEYGH